MHGKYLTSFFILAIVLLGLCESGRNHLILAINNEDTIALMIGDSPVYTSEITFSEEAKIARAKRNSVVVGSPEHLAIVEDNTYHLFSNMLDMTILELACKERGIYISDEVVMNILKEKLAEAGLNWETAQEMNKERVLIFEALNLVHEGKLSPEEAFNEKLKDGNVPKSKWENQQLIYLNKDTIPEPRLIPESSFDFENYSGKSIDENRWPMLTLKFNEFLKGTITPTEEEIDALQQRIKENPRGSFVRYTDREKVKELFCDLKVSEVRRRTCLGYLDLIENKSMPQEKFDLYMKKIRVEYEIKSGKGKKE